MKKLYFVPAIIVVGVKTPTLAMRIKTASNRFLIKITRLLFNQFQLPEVILEFVRRIRNPSND